MDQSRPGKTRGENRSRDARPSAGLRQRCFLPSLWCMAGPPHHLFRHRACRQCGDEGPPSSCRTAKTSPKPSRDQCQHLESEKKAFGSHLSPCKSSSRPPKREPRAGQTAKKVVPTSSCSCRKYSYRVPTASCNRRKYSLRVPTASCNRRKISYRVPAASCNRRKYSLRVPTSSCNCRKYSLRVPTASCNRRKNSLRVPTSSCNCRRNFAPFPLVIVMALKTPNLKKLITTLTSR